MESDGLNSAVQTPRVQIIDGLEKLASDLDSVDLAVALHLDDTVE